MLNNQTFLQAISESFDEFLSSGTSRSTAKLKPLHGAIARDLAERLGSEYERYSQGYGCGKEAKIEGRYMDKMVDITIQKENKPVAGIAVKFVMQNYSQNSNNYFENMLGETANIRCNNYPYFQIFIILDKLPYYDNKKKLKHWETFSEHNISKYVALANDNVDTYYHTPNKTLVFVLHIPENEALSKKDEYLSYYQQLNFKLTISTHQYKSFGPSVVLNDIETFMDKVYHTIKAI